MQLRDAAIVWKRILDTDPKHGTWAATVSPDGTVGEHHLLTPDLDVHPLSTVRVGNGWLFVFTRVLDRLTSAVFAQRLSPALEPLAAPQVISLSHKADPDSAGNFGEFKPVVANGDRAYVAWNVQVAPNLVHHGALVDGEGHVVRRDPIGVSALPQVPLAATGTADRTLGIWSETDVGGVSSRLLYARTARGGGTIDPEPLQLSEAASFDSVATSALDFDVLAVWREADDVIAPRARLRAAIIHVADGSQVPVALPSALDPHGSLAVANNGADWLVAAGATYVRISRAGLVLTPQPIVLDARAPVSVSIASDGARFFVLWGSRPDRDCPSCGGLAYAIVSAAGTIAKPPARIESDPNDSEVSVAFNGRDFLVESAFANWISLRRFSPAGALRSTSILNVPRATVTKPQVVRLGSGWLATWRKDATATLATRVTADGDLVDAALPLPSVVAVGQGADGRAVLAAALTVEVPSAGTAKVATVQELQWLATPSRRAPAR